MTAPPAEANLDDLRRRARRRLVGAIVLALAAAVFVPMLLESEPKPLGEDVSVRIPPVDDGKFVNKLGEKGRGDAKASAAKGDARTDAATNSAPKPAHQAALRQRRCASRTTPSTPGEIFDRIMNASSAPPVASRRA